MERERWLKIERVYHSARERPASERALFVAEACAGDDSLRREVESLLAQGDGSGSFQGAPTVEVAAKALARDHAAGTSAPDALAGRKISQYQVLEKLGEGGMGKVYRARDTKLGRDVALKMLPEEFARHPERLARFQREARLLASLNYPNIAAVYGLEESAGLVALVMELVEGPTLAKIIAAGPLPIPEALPIARQIAEALEFAHDKGIIHRDLKPANIQLTKEHQVKILDFGLAKALEGEASQADVGKSPTAPAEATQAGMIMGTPGYMSPEQAQGKNVDRRADIWAFGCVLHEMLTGKPTFKGETSSDTLAAVLTAEPDWDALPATTPRPIRNLLSRCLEKNPKRRLQAMGEARITIEESLAPVPPLAGAMATETLPLSGSPAGTPALEPTRQHALPWAVAAILLISTAILTALLLRQPSAPSRAVRSYLLPPEKTLFAFEGEIGTPVISPDGSRLVFAARSSAGVEMLWVRPLDSVTAQPLAGTEGARYPFWSPDSRSVGYFASGKLMRIDTFGGPTQTVCDAPNGRGGTWSAAGTIVFAPVGTGRLEQVSASGGTPTPLLQRDKFTLRWPVFLPDGRHFLYFAGSLFFTTLPDAAGIYLGSLDEKEGKFLLPAESNALYAPPGFLLYLRDSTLVAQPFDAHSLALTGEAFPLAEHVANPLNYRLGQFSVSQYGDLAYHSGSVAPDQVVWMDAGGKQLGTVGEPGLIWEVRFSPDGKTLAETIGGPQSINTDIWTVDLASGARTRLTFGPSIDSFIAWSPDGSKIAYSSTRNGQYDIYLQSANGTGTAERLLADDTSKSVRDWSRDGRYIVFDRGSQHQNEIWILPLFGDRKPYPFLQSRADERYASFSPDGKWLAYDSDESGHTEIYVAPFPQGNGKWQVSTAGGAQARWRPDGKELFYLSDDDKLMAATIQEKGGSLEIGTPRALFQSSLSRTAGLVPYDVAPDGKKFVVLTLPTQSIPEPITLVTNWTALLKKQ